MICPYFAEPLYYFYVPDLPGLFYYTYVPAMVVALVAGTIIFLSDRKSLPNRLLAAICLSFLVWTFCTFITWTNIHSDTILFAWSLLFPAASFLSIFSVYFTYVFLQRKDVGFRLKAIFTALLAPQLLLAPTAYSLSGFNLTQCDAFGFEGVINTVYPHVLGVFAMLWILVLLVQHYRRAEPGFKKQIALMGTGIELFLFSFFVTGFLGQYLTTIGFLPDSQLETYGYFGMIVFVVYITILMVRYHTFHASFIAAQALTAGLFILIISQFAFIRNSTNILLNLIALLLTTVMGFILIRSVKREIELRQHVEVLAKDLEKSNQQQIILIHFITHQIKGFVSKSRNIFAGLREGDYGVLPEAMVPMVEEGFRSDTKGAQTIQEILNAANIKSGKVSYAKEPFDLKVLIQEVVNDLSPLAAKKGLQLTSTLDDVTFTGDKIQLVNAFKNLIDNSIKYTPSGSVAVSLNKTDKTIHFEIKDTGVGITEEDMKNLFTEGGHGKNSQKVNVESTGFGLFIVKNIVEAHGGKVWAESEGEGKGSRFIVELPV